MFYVFFVKLGWKIKPVWWKELCRYRDASLIVIKYENIYWMNIYISIYLLLKNRNIYIHKQIHWLLIPKSIKFSLLSCFQADHPCGSAYMNHCPHELTHGLTHILTQRQLSFIDLLQLLSTSINCYTLLSPLSACCQIISFGSLSHEPQILSLTTHNFSSSQPIFLFPHSPYTWCSTKILAVSTLLPAVSHLLSFQLFSLSKHLEYNST